MKTENQVPEIHPNSPLGGVHEPIGVRPQASRKMQMVVVIVVALFLGAAFVLGLIPRLRAHHRLLAGAQPPADPSFTITNVTRVASKVELTLPGDVRAFEETKIYARADGYLLRWHSDIGSKVEAGQALAEIDTPELDQELNQSRAALAQAQANLDLARSSAERWQNLLRTRAVSQQEVDEKSGALAARAADLKAAEAAVSRLEKLSSFKTVRAPFAGTITRRSVDPGALIRTVSGIPLFELAQTERLRVQVNVPQAYFRDLTIGSPVSIVVAEYPGRTFSGTVLRTSGAFDATTRTMLTEIEVPNPDRELFPGIHVEVQMTLAQTNPPLVIPATALMVRSDGQQVAEVDSVNVVHLRKVQTGRDLGRTIEVVTGLADGASIVTNPTDTLADGMLVRIANAPNTMGRTASSPSLESQQLAKR